MTPDREALARLIDGLPLPLPAICPSYWEGERARSLLKADRIIAAGWTPPVAVPAAPSGAQQVAVREAITFLRTRGFPRPAECDEMADRLEAALAASEPAPSITSLPDPTPAEKVPAGPVAFCFVPGVLYIDKHGNGHFQFDAADLDFCPHDDKEGSYVQIRVEASEIEAMRELLNERAAPSPAPDEGDGPAPGEALPLAWPPGKRRACPSPDAIRAQAIEEAARWHDEQAATFLTLAGAADKAGDALDARAHRYDAREHNRAAAALRALSPLPPGSRVVVIPEERSEAWEALVDRLHQAANAYPYIHAFRLTIVAALRALTEGEKP